MTKDSKYKRDLIYFKIDEKKRFSDFLKVHNMNILCEDSLTAQDGDH